MRPLLELEQRHPIASTIVGTLSGLTSWLFAHVADVTAVAGMIGAVCTALIAMTALAAKVASIIAHFRRRAAHRRRHFRDEPFEDHLP